MLIGAGHVVAGSVFVFGATWINKLNRIVLLSMQDLEATAPSIVQTLKLPIKMSSDSTRRFHHGIY